MAEVTVSELAKTVGASVDRLLMQMKEAGLSHGSADATVSDEEKQTLLADLKSLHGASVAETEKSTLRRKTVSTLKSGNRKSVNIEVRKKRTYVKRSDEELETKAAAEAEEKARTAEAGGKAEAERRADEERLKAEELKRQQEQERVAAQQAEKAAAPVAPVSAADLQTQ